ncbi:heavy metal translocating P-type ATPase [Fenollaria massiliensis]|uniref:Cd(2+)-exporting ATPase n=1 Tax=Fenollaria massiliensis TaxID=938288 RepID=A0A9E7DKR4_9FIRM|nr:cation-translocating P-type ATPase [Fenollaria massiliensis]UQK59567.1 cadmium-translocating P-type ATPase [Fenollaria massiliensis]
MEKLILNGLNCANCAQKIESFAKNQKSVESASLDFINSILTIEMKDEADAESTLREITKYVNDLEPDVLVTRGEAESEEEEEGFSKIFLLRIALSLLGLAAYLFIDSPYKMVFFGLSYIIISYDIIIHGVKGALRGILAEEFLMTVATVGAIFIGEYLEAVLVALLYQIGEIISDIAVDKSKDKIKELIVKTPVFATLINNGKEIQSEPSEVAVGSKIIVREGESIAIDGIVVEGNAKVDNAHISGESEPVYVDINSEVYSGAIVKEGYLIIETTKLAKNSTAARIQELVRISQSDKANLETSVSKFARVYTPIVVFIAALIALLAPVLKIMPLKEALHTCFAFLIVSCPCAIIISVPLAYFSGIGKMSKNGILFKGTKYLDQFRNIKTFCFDKTGTLTSGKFKLVRVEAIDMDEEKALHLARLAEYHSKHPIASAILDSRETIGKEEIISYTSLKNGVAAETKFGSVKVITSEKESEYKVLDTYLDDKLIGHLYIEDEIKDETKKLLSELKERNVKPVMLTGDTKIYAEKVAHDLGIDSFEAELLPQDKIKFFEKEQGKDGLVAFVGDGINDSPVIKRADIGLSMGALGSDAAIEASDIVIMDDRIEKIVNIFDTSHFVNKIIKENLFFTGFVKAAIIILALFIQLPLWLAVFGDVGVTLISVINTLRIR